jgi:CobQ-like glutamine amidotransferase family enzyme
MKKIKIAHLYYDLMNLYGENGNVRYLQKKLEEQEFDVSVYFLTVGDDIDFTKYDIYYIGMGSDDNKLIVLDDIIKYKKDIKEAINNNKYFLVTGNAIELFGEGIINLNNELKVTLETFKYQVREEEFRIVGEQYYETDLIDKKIVGFQNRSSVMINVKDNSLFNVINGTGYKPDVKIEGIHFNNFYGTYLLGPILVRNPYFCDYLIKDLCKDNNVTYNNKEDMAYKAYSEYLKNFYENQ